MAVAGIDVGSQSTKVVILEGDRILASVTLQTEESGESKARRAMEEALRQARLKLEDMKSVVATGAGRKNVGVVKKIGELLGGIEITVPAEPQIAGAVGAALFALDRARKKKGVEDQS
jgi:activator of 2-hydroxyglutaryl-CoA dehydratase